MSLVHSFRNLVPIIPLDVYKKMPDGNFQWMIHLTKIFFYKNQKEAFDCYLIELNNEVHISYNRKNALSCEFCDFIFNNLPKTKKDKKRRVFTKKIV
jgi:hypothetical protein